MKRDMDLIRQILFEIENKCNGDGVGVQPEIEGHSSEEVSYHIMLLSQAGYVEGDAWGGGSWKARTLTWQGHEFLDAARDESRWNKVKKIVKDKGGPIPFEILKQMLLKIVENAVLGKQF